MKIRVRCDCGKTLVAAGELAGKKTKCPACGAVIRLPRLDEASEQPASFLVTETGLNLTDVPQEVCAAPAEEMPHPFNFSPAEQTQVNRPEHESFHGVSDASSTTNNKLGSELSTIPKLWAEFVTIVRAKSAEWTGLLLPLTDAEWADLRQSSANNSNPLDRQHCAEPFRVQRVTIIRIVAGCGLVAWLWTLGSPPSAWVVVHYLALAAGVVGITLEITGRTSQLKPFGVAIAACAVLGAWWLWPKFDCYNEQWVNDSGTTFTDSQTRSGRHYHRRMQEKNETLSDGTYILGNSMEGPMAGDPPKPHGHWTITLWRPFTTSHLWYWYGDTITQGEWELRNK